MQKTRQEKEYLLLCRERIETKLSWRPGSEWKQRDFLQLIELMQEKTGVLLSLSTLKRIWKPGFEGTPHPATLEAFAKFLDCENWLDFKSRVDMEHPAVSPAQNRAARPVQWKKLVAISLALIFLLIWTFQQLWRSPESGAIVQYNPQDVSFTCANAVGTGVPNTVIFNYDVRRVLADSFFIQQSWNPDNRERIPAQGKNLTSTYYYPGFHRAKLIANDSVISETDVQIQTKGWVALARNGYEDDFPVYFREDFLPEGRMSISQNRLEENNVILTQQTITSFYNIGGFDSLHSGDFTLETRLKCDSVLNIACPCISIIVQGAGEMYFLPITAKGCVGNIGVKLGDAVQSGKHNDLSALGANVYEWQTLRLEVKHRIARVFLNQKLVLELPFQQDIGKIAGLNINFTGTGTVEYVRVY